MASPASKIVKRSVSRVKRVESTFSILRGQGRPPLLDWAMDTASLVGLWSAELTLLPLIALLDSEAAFGVLFCRFALASMLTGALSMFLPKVLLYLVFLAQAPLYAFMVNDFSVFQSGKNWVFLVFMFAAKFYLAKKRKTARIGWRIPGFILLGCLCALLITSYYLQALAEPGFMKLVLAGN